MLRFQGVPEATQRLGRAFKVRYGHWGPSVGSPGVWPRRSPRMKIAGIMAPTTWIVTPDKFLGASDVRNLRSTMATAAETRDRYAVRNAAILETLLATGLRVSELCSLVVADLFLDSGSAHVLVRRGKGGKSRLLAISVGLAAYLSEFLRWKGSVGEAADPSSPVFLSERRCKMHRSAVHRVWKSALATASLPTRHGVHATRHSYAVEIYRKTKDLRLTQRQLGHSSPVVTQVYASLLDDDVRRGVEALWAV
jgi:site-specific recombinase XerD